MQRWEASSLLKYQLLLNSFHVLYSCTELVWEKLHAAIVTNFTNCFTVYEIGKFIVYKFIVHCVVYNKLLLQVYKFIVHQIVYSKCWYLQVTDQSVSYYTFSLLTVCFQPIRELLHFFTVAQPIRELLHFFIVAQPISELLHFFHCWHVQEQHYMAFISLLLMGLNYGL